MTNDLIESSEEITPQMHVYDAFHAESELIPVTRLNGITNAIVAPDNTDTLPGQDSFIQLDGKSATDMLLLRDIAMPLNFTGDQRRNKGRFCQVEVPMPRAWDLPPSCGRHFSMRSITSRNGPITRKRNRTPAATKKRRDHPARPSAT